MKTIAHKDDAGSKYGRELAVWGSMAASSCIAVILCLTILSPGSVSKNDAHAELSPVEQAAQTAPTVLAGSTSPDPAASVTTAPDSTSPGVPLATISAPQTSTQALTPTGPAYYVSTTGNDAADGSEANPWRSFQAAVSRLRAGDTLYILEGHYKDSAVFSQSGRSDAYIRVVGVGNVVIGGRDAADYMAADAFDTAGHSFIRFENLTVNHATMAVEVGPGSSYIDIAGLRTDGNRFALRIDTATNITVRNAYAINSKNAFRVLGASRNILFENIEAYASKDIYVGMSETYLNGDGFIMEREVSNVTLRNIISADHWDAGFDIKASNVLIENAVSYGNKNNYKTWGDNITIRNSVSYRAKRQPRPDGSTVEGHGLTVEDGTTTVVNVTFVNNQHFDVRVYAAGALWIKNSIVARQASDGWLFKSDGYAASENVLWYDAGKTGPSSDLQLSPTDLWADPQFVDLAAGNYRLKSSSPAVDYGVSSANTATLDLDGNTRVVSSSIDLGAYEYQGNGVPVPNPTPGPDPVPDPVPAPTPAPAPVPDPDPVPAPETPFVGLVDGQTMSGRIFFQPNAELMADVKLVRYYVNGKMKEKQSREPFMFGGKTGYDTTRMKDGTYELKAVVDLKSGGQMTFAITIHVKNRATASTSTMASAPTAMTEPPPVPSIVTQIKQVKQKDQKKVPSGSQVDLLLPVAPLSAQ